MTPTEFRVAAAAFAGFIAVVGVLRPVIDRLFFPREDGGESGCFALFFVAAGIVIYLACESVLQVAMALQLSE